MSEHLEDFLNHKRTAGSFDSEGKFTLNQSAIARKLAEFGLGTRARCLLRLIQMGIVAGAREVQISFGLEAVEIVLEGDRPDTAFLKSPDRPLFILLSGCIHAGFNEVLVSSGRNRYRLDKSFQFATNKGPFKSGVSFLFSGPYEEDVKTEVKGRLRACPAKVLVDRQAINRTQPTQRLLLDFELQSRETNFAESLWSDERPAPTPPLVSFFVWSDSDVQFILQEDGILTENKLTKRWKTLLQARDNVSSEGHVGSTITTVALLHLPVKRQPRTALFFVKNGIIVDRLESAWPGGLEGYVSAVGLDTDLSGLRLVRNRKLKARLAELKSSLKRLVPSLTRSELAGLKELLQ